MQMIDLIWTAMEKKQTKQRRIPGQGLIWLSIADAESFNAFQGKNLILGLWVSPIKEVI